MGFGGLVNTSSETRNISNTANYADSFNRSSSTVSTQGDIGTSTINIGQSEGWEKVVPYAFLAVLVFGAIALLKGGRT